MIHRVDYRDHFFKYPYFFLMFSDWVWNTFLNPGDLYRWRLDDHLEAAKRAGVRVETTYIETDHEAYRRLNHRILSRFMDQQHNEVLLATLIVM
jgi:hypothetical protein